MIVLTAPGAAVGLIMDVACVLPVRNCVGDQENVYCPGNGVTGNTAFTVVYVPEHNVADGVETLKLKLSVVILKVVLYLHAPSKALTV